MIVCAATPYEGDKPYIFFSYCHADATEVYPIIENMAEAGFRIWYDDGIHPGEDWQEIIARHLANCAVCIAAVTERSVSSHNCRNEVNFTINNDINFIPIILEQFQMSLGVELQLSSGQYIQKFAQPSEEAFYAKLYAAQGIGECRDAQSRLNPDIAERRRQEAERIAREKAAEDLRRQREQTLREIRDPAFEPNEPPEPEPDMLAEDIKEKPPDREEEIPAPPPISEESIKQPETENLWAPRRKPVTQSLTRNAAVVILETRELFPLSKVTTRIGRQDDCDIVLRDDTVSAQQAEIQYAGDGFFMRNPGSVPGNSVNFIPMENQQSVPLKSGDWLTFGNTTALFALDVDVERFQREAEFAYLDCMETGERIALGAKNFPLGRTHAWPGGTLSDLHVSKDHGVIIPIAGGHGFQAADKKATNGTFYNGDELAIGERFQLLDGDELRLASVYHLRYHRLRLHIVERKEE